MIDSLPRCNQCNSPVTDSIEVEIEHHGKVKMGKYTRGSWVCDDCMMKRADEEKLSVNTTIQDDSNSKHHEHIGDASKIDVSPNTPPADEANL